MHLSTLTQSLFNKIDGLVILSTDTCFGMYLYGLTVIFDLLHPLSRHYEYFLHTLCSINMSLIADTFFLFSLLII